MFKIQFDYNSKLRAIGTAMSNKIVVLFLMFVMSYWKVIHLLYVLSEVDQPRKIGNFAQLAPMTPILFSLFQVSERA